jgi:hypothetical protein
MWVDDASNSEYEDLEEDMEGGGGLQKKNKNRNGRLKHRVRTLRRAVEMRRAEGGGPGGRSIVSRSARQALKRGGGGGRGGGKVARCRFNR